MSPQYDWAIFEREEILAPFSTRHLAYPYRDDYNVGPYGASFADDRWESRKTWVVRMDPKREIHPHYHKDSGTGQETYEPLYRFAYDRSLELLKILWQKDEHS